MEKVQTADENGYGEYEGSLWTVNEESKDDTDIFDPLDQHQPPVAPSNGRGGHGLSLEEVRALQEKRRRLK